MVVFTCVPFSIVKVYQRTCGFLVQCRARVQTRGHRAKCRRRCRNARHSWSVASIGWRASRAHLGKAPQLPLAHYAQARSRRTSSCSQWRTRAPNCGPHKGAACAHYAAHAVRHAPLRPTRGHNGTSCSCATSAAPLRVPPLSFFSTNSLHNGMSVSHPSTCARALHAARKACGDGLPTATEAQRACLREHHVYTEGDTNAGDCTQCLRPGESQGLRACLAGGGSEAQVVHGLPLKGGPSRVV